MTFLSTPKIITQARSRDFPLNLLKLIFKSEEKPHIFINSVFSLFFQNADESPEWIEFARSKNLNKKVKQLQIKLLNESYSYVAFKNLIVGHLDFIPDGDDRDNIMALLNIEAKNRDLAGKKCI
jgi:hypothetical protein